MPLELLTCGLVSFLSTLGEELLARFSSGGGARELGATARVLTALFGIAWHGLLRQILTD
jgi:hypothetical protein